MDHRLEIVRLMKKISAQTNPKKYCFLPLEMKPTERFIHRRKKNRFLPRNYFHFSEEKECFEEM